MSESTILDKKELLRIKENSEAVLIFSFIFAFLIIIAAVFKNETNKELIDNIINALRVLVLIGLLIIGFVNARKLLSSRFRGYSKTSVYRQASSRFVFAILSLNTFSGDGTFYRIISRQNYLLHKLIIVEIFILIVIFIIAMMDKIYRGTDEGFGDELTQKTFDEGAKNAFYLTLSGIVIYQITISIWQGFKRGLIDTFGINSIDFSSFMALTIIIISWLLGQFAARDRYR